MGFLDKAKEAAEQAATKAKQGVDDVQSKRDASQAYGDLGRETFALIEAGEISHPALNEIAERIRKSEAGEPAEAAAAPPPTAPPAMPS